jgi:hypothetical protein
MTTVYLVMKTVPYEGDSFIASFSTDQKAEAYINALGRWRDRYFVLETVLDCCGVKT